MRNTRKKKSSFRHMMSINDIGIDLGTANTLVYKTHKGIILREPSVVALDSYTHKPLAVGMQAKKMIGRTPDSILAIRPLKEGVIADLESSIIMMRYFIQKAIGRPMFTKNRILVCVPYGVTDVERRAVTEAAYQCGAKDVRTIEEPLAAAIGAGLPVSEPTGSMIVDIGGGTTEVAVVSMGGIVTSQSVRTAGDTFDTAIINYIKNQFNLYIGEKTAEEIKITIGSAHEYEGQNEMEIRGRDLVTGLPKNITITSEQIREAMAEPMEIIITAIKETLEQTPPELAADIIDRGITLTGGGAMLHGFDTLLHECTGISVFIAQNPLDCVVLGTGATLEDAKLWNALEP